MQSWPGLAAIGAGLIHLGIAAASTPLVLAAFALVGAVEVGWGVAALARARPPLLRIALAVAVLLVGAWGALLLAGGGHDHANGAEAAPAIVLPLAPMSGAGLLDLAAALVLAVALRRGSDGPARMDSATVDPAPLRFLLGTAAAAAVVAVVATTSLAAVPATAHLH